MTFNFNGYLREIEINHIGLSKYNIDNILIDNYTRTIPTLVTFSTEKEVYIFSLKDRSTIGF